MDRFLEAAVVAVGQQDGDAVAAALRLDAEVVAAKPPAAQDAARRLAEHPGRPAKFVSAVVTQGEAAGLPPNYAVIYAEHLTALGLLVRAAQGGAKDRPDLMKQAFTHQVAAFDKLLRFYGKEGSWAVTVLRTFIRDTRLLAAATDRATKSKTNESLRDAKRLLENCFRVTMIGQAVDEDGLRKRQVALYIVNNQFRVFFGLKSLQLCRNLVNQVQNKSFPDMDTFTLSERVTYNYFYGRLLIFQDSLVEAREALQFALINCHPSSPRNIRRIYEYLVPINLFIGRRPAQGALAHFGIDYLDKIITATRMGNVRALEAAIQERRDEYIARGLFLSLDRLKLVAYRNLFRNVVAVFQRTTTETKKERVVLDTFVGPFRSFGEEDPLAFLQGEDAPPPPPPSDEEVLEQIKCILSNLIHKRCVKGYISHERNILVLSPKEPFPALDTVSL